MPDIPAFDNHIKPLSQCAVDLIALFLKKIVILQLNNNCLTWILYFY